MKTISLDLRERILKAYDTGESTREKVGRRFAVSLGMVKKLIQQRRHTGEIRARHYRSGRKARILAEHRQGLQKLLVQKPDLTLSELRSKLAIACSLPAIHYVLAAMGLTYKKRRSAQRSRTGRTSSGHGVGGGAGKAASIRQGSSSLMSRRPRRT